MKPVRFYSWHEALATWLVFLLAGMSWQPMAAQGMFDQGSACGCPEVALRDTVWVSDNAGAGVGTVTWSCDHLYVLTEQVFVNPLDTLTIEPGTAILGMGGEGRQSFFCAHQQCRRGFIHSELQRVPWSLDCRAWRLLGSGRCRVVSHSILVFRRSVGRVRGMNVQGQWGGLVLCGGGAINTLYLEGIDQPSQTGGIGTGEDRAEGVVDLSGQDRHVYGGNTAPLASSGTLKYVSVRHGSTNLGWNNVLNGNETDLLQLAGCGEGTTLDYLELVASADDGLHVFGGHAGRASRLECLSRRGCV